MKGLDVEGIFDAVKASESEVLGRPVSVAVRRAEVVGVVIVRRAKPTVPAKTLA